jgi:hypothetical protein
MAHIRQARCAGQSHARPLPAKCREFNPAETVCPFMRDTWLSNRVFLNPDDLLDPRREA